MTTVTISTKGQITLPAHLRRRFGIEPHDLVLVEASPDGILVRRAPDIFSLRGSIKVRPKQTLETARRRMQEAVGRQVLGEDESQ